MLLVVNNVEGSQECRRYKKLIVLYLFYATGLFLYPLKTSENLLFFEYFRGYANRFWADSQKVPKTLEIIYSNKFKNKQNFN